MNYCLHLLKDKGSLEVLDHKINMQDILGSPIKSLGTRHLHNYPITTKCLYFVRFQVTVVYKFNLGGRGEEPLIIPVSLATERIIKG